MLLGHARRHQRNTLSASNGYSSAMFYIVVDVMTSIGTFA